MVGGAGGGVWRCGRGAPQLPEADEHEEEGHLIHGGGPQEE